MYDSLSTEDEGWEKINNSQSNNLSGHLHITVDDQGQQLPTPWQRMAGCRERTAVQSHLRLCRKRPSSARPPVDS